MSKKAVRDLLEIKDKYPKELVHPAKVDFTDLLNADESYNHILGNLGLDHNIPEKKLNNDFKRSNKGKEIYLNNEFTGAMIKEYCNKYDLKILQTQYFNGTVPPSIPRLVNEFIEKNKLDKNKVLNPSKGNSYFFILAPVEQFRTIQHVPINRDPILFYTKFETKKITKGHNLTQVCNWGNDFSEWRRLRWLTSTSEYYEDSSSMLTGFIFFIVMFAICSVIGILNFGLGVFFSAIVGVWFVIATRISETSRDKLWNEEKI